jgi:hypothetical protein
MSDIQKPLILISPPGSVEASPLIPNTSKEGRQELSEQQM